MGDLELSGHIKQITQEYNGQNESFKLDPRI